MTISIIIPTHNEESHIEKLVNFIHAHNTTDLVDLLVIDGGSTDKTCDLACKAGATVLHSPEKGRAGQMNFGAMHARGDILYFIHADCLPAASFMKDIQTSVSQGYDLGRYRTRFDTNKFILKINAWFTRFDLFACMGGDQTLFMRRELFESCKGFSPEMRIMEEYDLCRRARKAGKYKIMPGQALISARKYNHNTWLKVQLANAKVVRMFRNGASQEEMIETYHQMLNYR